MYEEKEVHVRDDWAEQGVEEEEDEEGHEAGGRKVDRDGDRLLHVDHHLHDRHDAHEDGQKHQLVGDLDPPVRRVYYSQAMAVKLQEELAEVEVREEEIR